MRPVDATVIVGDVANIGLYAVWDGQEHDSFSVIRVIFTWDPEYLQFMGIDNTGGVPLLSSSVPYPHYSGLNESDPPQDGDALYIAMAQLGVPVLATIDGVLLTTFQYTALQPTPSTDLGILPEWGVDPVINTVVIDGEIPGLDITGLLIGASITLIDSCPADINDDGFVNVADLLILLGNWGTSGPGAELAEPYDVVNVSDLLVLLAAWGVCP